MRLLHAVVLLAIATVSLAGADPTRLLIRGSVVTARGGRALTEGSVELRWPGHEDAFTPVTAPLREDGTFLLQATLETDRIRPQDLTVTAMARACELQEKPLPAAATGAPTEAIVVDFELTSSTLNGILDIFHCCILTWGILTVMLPAFLLGAAITAFVPSQYVLNLLGPGAPRLKAYGAAVGSGMVLSLCSCNVVPLFAGIWRRGAGTGPAFAFLYSGPAINLVAMIFTCQVIGLPIGVFRILAVAVIAVTTGVIMARLFGEAHHDTAGVAPLPVLPCGPSGRVTALLIGLLLYLLVTGAFSVSIPLRLALTVPAAVGIVVLALTGLGRANTAFWLKEAWQLVLLVVPVLLPAVLIIGLLAMYTPLTVTRWMSGNNSALANFGAAAFGALMYFPILTEVAFAKAMLKVMGVGIGPAMALILTAPGLSLPGMIIIRREVGWKYMLTYVFVVTLLATLAGAFFGSEWGRYLCSCAL